MTDEHFEKAWGTTLMSEQEQKKVKGQNGQTDTAPPGPATDTDTATTPPAIPQIDGMDIVNAAKDLDMKANTKGYETGLNKDDIDAAYVGLADQIGERYRKEHEDVGKAPEKDEAKMREEREAANRAEGNYYKEQKWDTTADMERIGEKETLEVPNYREHVTDDQMQGWGRALANFGSVGLKEGANAIDAATKALGEFRKLTRAFLSPNPMSAASQMLASTMVGMNTMYDTIDRAGEIAGIKQGADRSIVMETAKGAQYYKDKDRATRAANFMMQAFNDQIADTLGPDGDVTQLNPAQFKRIYEKIEEAWAPEIERIRKEHAAGVPPSLEDRAIMAGWDNISKQYVKNMREGKATAREYSKEIGEHEKNIRALDQDYNRRVKEYNKVIADIDKRALGEQRALDKEYRSDMKNIGKESKAMETWQRGYDDAVANNDAIGALLRVTLGPGAQRHLKDGNAVEHTLLTAQNRANANAHKDNANFTDEQKAVWSRIAEYLGQRVQEVRNMSAEQRRQYARSLAGPRAIEGAKGTGRRGGQADDDPLGFFDKTKKQRNAIRKMTSETYADKMVKKWWEGHALSEDQAQDPRSSKLYKGAENIIRQMARIERSVYKKGNKLTPEKRARALALMEKHQDDLDTIEDLLWGYQQIDTSTIFPPSYLDQYQGMNRNEYLATLNSKEREFPKVTGKTTDVSSYNAASDEYEGAKKELETLRYDFLHGMYDDSWQYRRDAKLKGERLQRRIDRLRNTLTAQKEEFDKKQAEREAKHEEATKENQKKLAAASADGLRAVLGDETAFRDYVKDNLHTQENFKNPYFADSGRARLMELAEDMTPEERKIIADYLSRSGYSKIDALVDKLMEGYQPEEIIPTEEENEGGETEEVREDYGVIERAPSNDNTGYETNNNHNEEKGGAEESRVDEDVIDERENTEVETTGTENTIDGRNPIYEDWKTKLNEAINNGDEFTLDQLISELDGRISVVNNKNKESKGKGKTITDLENLLANAKEKREDLRKRAPEGTEEQKKKNLTAAYTEGTNVPVEEQVVGTNNTLDETKFKEPGVDPRGADSKDLEKELEYSGILEREEEEKERKKKEELANKTKIFKGAFGNKGVLFKNLGPKDVELDENDENGRFKADMGSVGQKLYDNLEALNKTVGKNLNFSTAFNPKSREDITKAYNALKNKTEFIRDNFILDEEKHAGILSQLNTLDKKLDQMFRYAYAHDYEGLGKDIPDNERIYTRAEKKERKAAEEKAAQTKYLEELPGNMEDGFLKNFNTISNDNIGKLNSAFKIWAANEIRAHSGKLPNKNTMKRIIETKVPKGYFVTIGKLTDDNPIELKERKQQAKRKSKTENFQSNASKTKNFTSDAMKTPVKEDSKEKKTYSAEDLANWYQDQTHVFTDEEISALKGKVEDVAMHIYDENKSNALIAREILDNIENLKKRGAVEEKEKNTDPTKKSATPSFRDMLTKRFDETHKGGYFVG